MTRTQFTNALALTRMQTESASTYAAYAVLVDKRSAHAAAKMAGIHVSAVSRAVARLRAASGEVKVCHACHQPLPAAAA